MSVYGMGIDAILMCFLYGEEFAKSGKQLTCPPLLKEFFDNKDWNYTNFIDW